MGISKRKPASRADLEALPEHVKGEIIDGVLYTMARPRPGHASAQAGIAGDLHAPFQRGRGGPGGWWILVEPGIEAPGSPEFAPDLAGWRKERLPALPEAGPIAVVPDWACEIMSPSNRGYDQRIKRPFYARIGVAWLWYVDVEARTVTVSRLVDGRWVEMAIPGEDDRVRVPPFEAIELALGEWWTTPPGEPAR